MISKSSWNVYCTRFLVRARQLTEPIAFTDPLGHEHIGHPGDYLVETSNGIRRVATRAFFEDTYMPIAPTQPALRLGNLHEPRASDFRNESSPRPHQGEERPQAMA
ncbi:MAG: hypothetical protein WA213_06950 [Terriglobales bacterium]